MPKSTAGKQVNFGFHLLFLTAIELVPGEEEGGHLTTNPAFDSVITATALVKEIGIHHADI